MENLQKNGTSFLLTPLPYELEASANGYHFVTDFGTKYELTFYQIHTSYPIYSFAIERQSDTYHADARDGRQYARFKLFDKWYQPYKQEYYREVYCKDIYFSSIIARRDNPLAKEMAEWFVALMSEMIDNI